MIAGLPADWQTLPVVDRERQTDGHEGPMHRTAPSSIDEYIATCAPEVRAILEKIRRTVRDLVPEAKEKISYQMPAFTLNGDLIYFAAFKKHIGLYPPVKGDAALERDLAPYRNEKGNLRFPLDEPMPYPLIRRVIELRLQEHQKHLEQRAAKRTKNKSA